VPEGWGSDQAREVFKCFRARGDLNLRYNVTIFGLPNVSRCRVSIRLKIQFDERPWHGPRRFPLNLETIFTGGMPRALALATVSPV
jgi:hypothetical protein